MSNSIFEKVLNLENNILSLSFLIKNEFTMLGLYISFTLCNYLMGSYKTFFIIGLLTGKVIFFNKNININIIDFKEHLLHNLKINYKSKEITSISNKQNGEISEEIVEEILEKNSNNYENIKDTMNDHSNDESSDSFDTCIIKNNNNEDNNEDDSKDDNQDNLSQSYINSQLNINDSYIEEKTNSTIRTRSMSRKND